MSQNPEKANPATAPDNGPAGGGAEPASAPPVPPAPEDEDCYMDGPYMVFTRAFHLKRGYCCGSNCRHCPFGRQLGASVPLAE